MDSGTPAHIPLTGIICNTDGSWKEGCLGGIGYAFTNREALMVYRSASQRVHSPLHAEARALLLAIQHAISSNWGPCTFCSDSQELVLACTTIHPPTEVDWRAHREVHDIWILLNQCPDYLCVFVPRIQNGLADYLAKQGRKGGWDQQGYTFPIFGVSQC